MSLNLNKLEKVRKLENGMVQARCPACAEGGTDRKGEHLRILADGRFGCCVHPKDGDHRKRIFALAGEKSSGTFTVRVKVLAHGHHSAAPAPQSVKAALTDFSSQPSSGLRTPSPAPASERPGTIGTGKAEPDISGEMELPLPPDKAGTLGTLFSNPYAYEKNLSHMYKESDSAVPSVMEETRSEPAPSSGEKLPYLTGDGTLVIPFDSPERYHWWKPDGERMTVAQTMEEVKERVRAALATHERNELCP